VVLSILQNMHLLLLTHTLLKENHRDNKAYHDDQIYRLQAEVRKVQARIDAAYEDKLDCNISEVYWKRKSGNGR